MSQFISSKGPYIHEKAYHFRKDVSDQLVGTDTNKTVSNLLEASTRLSSMISALRSEALVFLQPWGGDYKAASKDIFGNNLGESNAQYKYTLNEIINSSWFIETVRRRKSKNNTLDEKSVQEALNILQEFGLAYSANELQGKTLDDMLQLIISSIHVENGKKQIRLEGNNLKKGMERLLGKELEQRYYRNLDSLKKQISQALAKHFKLKINWEGVFREVKDRFMSEYVGNKQAEDFINKLRIDFIKTGESLKTTQYANIAGFISENLQPVITNNDSSTSVLIHVTGDIDETTLAEEARRFALQASGHFGLKVPSGQISKMGHRNIDKQQSGTDWLITNQNGKMIRAQVKNSTQIAEELRQAEVSHPQPIHLQSEIKYTTLKQNLQKYSAGTIGGLSSEDWLLIDYLIANMLWIRAGGAVTKDKSGNYSSGVSGIQELINQLLTKEVGYFLGVSLAPEDKVGAVNAVMGGSNVFFVLDNLLLYPTWMIIESIQKQLVKIGQALAKIYVRVSSSYIPSKTEYQDTKEWAKGEDGPWKQGQPYGPTVLETGQNYGMLILESTKANVNLNININQIINEVYEEGLRGLR